jgi:hypothetical protein
MRGLDETQTERFEWLLQIARSTGFSDVRRTGEGRWIVDEANGLEHEASDWGDLDQMIDAYINQRTGSAEAIVAAFVSNFESLED